MAVWHPVRQQPVVLALTTNASVESHCAMLCSHRQTRVLREGTVVRRNCAQQTTHPPCWMRPPITCTVHRRTLEDGVVKFGGGVVVISHDSRHFWMLSLPDEERSETL
jgi:hypothetical protein